VGQIDGPEIGDSVWIGAHAKIFGPVKVGARATIAPGACVTKDVPRNSLIVGAPARIVSRRYDNSHILPRI
jgi:serine O-acetyltransferase